MITSNILTEVLTSSTLWTAISAIATFAMAFITYKTLKQNREQLNELKVQREEDNRARIVCSAHIHQVNGSYMLMIENIGRLPAYDVNIQVTGEPITNHLFDYIRYTFSQLAKKTFTLPAGQSLSFYLYPSEEIGWDYTSDITGESTLDKRKKWLDDYKEKKIIITGRYNSQYEIHEVFTLNERFISGSYIEQTPLNFIGFVLRNLSRTQKEYLELEKHKYYEQANNAYNR